MNRITNPLLMLVPEESMPQVLVLMIMIGGLLMVVGARRSGLALVLTAISLPFITHIVEALMNHVFDAVPDWAVQPLAWALMAVAYLALAVSLIVLLVGERVWRDVKTQLAVRAIVGLFSLVFWWPAMLIWVPALAYFMWRPG